ncbi:hypothetical protein GC176_15600 [bacterium]|nr:hypothetical protein [bacterium]
MKLLALICLCLPCLAFVAGCESAAEPVPEETATQSESVEGQLESSGMSDQDYEKALKESYQQSQQQQQDQ